MPQLLSATCCTVFTRSAGPRTTELVSPAAPPPSRPRSHGFDTNGGDAAGSAGTVAAFAEESRAPPPPRYRDTAVLVEKATALMRPYATIGAPIPR